MPGAETDHDVGRVLGQRYQLERRIGVGASAVVYRAVDLNLRRSVAVKQLKPELSGDSRFIKLFRSEAHLAGQLDHPNVLTIHDWSADEDGEDGGAYIVTEYLTGGTLRQLLDRDGVLSVEDAARIGLQVAQGLRAAHGAGLVHRDIKPGNLLFGADGRVRIGDFGIARAVAEAAWTEPEGHLIGTARYAAPEQSQQGEVNGRADIYSLAVCLTEMVTGEVPLVGESSIATMMIRLDEDLPAPDELGDLADLVGWAGLAEWAARPSADQLVDELASIHGIAGLDPVTVIDLTSNLPASPVSNPSLSPSSDSAFDVSSTPTPMVGSDGAGDEPGWLADPGAVDGIVGEDADGDIDWTSWADDGLASGQGSDEVAGATLSDRTADDYMTSIVPDGGRRRGRRRLVIGLVALALAAAGAAAGGWYYGEYRQGTVEVIEVALPSWPVPDFDGIEPDEATSLVEPYGWTVTVEERHIDGTVAGELLEQRPPPGQVSGPGLNIELVRSLGPVPRQVPDLVGATQDEADQAIAAARLTVGTVTEVNDEEAEAGTVLEATIGGEAASPGTEYPTGTVVDLVISAGPAPRVVPALVGLSRADAERALQPLALTLGVTEDFSETVPEGQIIGVSPAAGTQVPRGSTVTVTVSLGLPLIQIPDLAGRPVLEAVDELSALGFTVRIEGAAEADVLGTRPQAGSQARLGASVTIVSTQE